MPNRSIHPISIPRALSTMSLDTQSYFSSILNEICKSLMITELPVMLDDFNFHKGLGVKLYNFRVRYSENQTLFWTQRPSWHLYLVPQQNHSQSRSMIFKMIFRYVHLWGCTILPTRDRKKILDTLFIFILKSKKEIKLS